MPMDPISLVLKQSGLPAALNAATKLITNLLGPASEEAGLLLQDHVRRFRLINQLKVLGKTQNFLDQSGINPKTVPLRVLAPLLESASLNDDESLSEKWACLLANASLGKSNLTLTPLFIKILEQLTPIDVLLLDYLRNQRWIRTPHTEIQYFEFRPTIQKSLELSDIDYKISCENLSRLGLCSLDNTLLPDNVQEDLKKLIDLDGKLIRHDVLILTEFGIEFINSCTTPGETIKGRERIEPL